MAGPLDGPTRVYHGCLTNLPRRYISRERLCLRGTTDYWVNALDDQPFFNPAQDAVVTHLCEDVRQRGCRS